MTAIELKSKLNNPQNIEGIILNNGTEIVPGDLFGSIIRTNLL